MQVSVVVPTYERADDLSRLFNGLLDQSVKPAEVIVVDDSPTQLIMTLCQKYKLRFEREDVELIFVKNPRERSAAVARNVGAEMSQGEVVMFFDSDVILHSKYVEEVLNVFEKYPNAVGVQGWILNAANVKVHPVIQVVESVFRFPHLAKNSCRIDQYPRVLEKTINCETLSGANMAVRRKAFGDFKFDEGLKGYSYMEDLLFSYSMHKRYPSGLYITPDARCIHKVSAEGRIEGEQLRARKDEYRLYVLRRLFGWRGMLLFCWQNVGYGVLRIISQTRRRYSKTKMHL